VLFLEAGVHRGSGLLITCKAGSQIKRGANITQKILAGREMLATPGVLLVFVLALGGLLAGCGSSGEEGNTNVPTSPEAAGNVAVRVSGTEGIAFSGTYGTIEGSLQTVDDTIKAEPTDYQVEIQKGVSDGVTAGFQKTQPGEGALKVEILADDKAVVESRTLVEFGAVNVDWFPQIGPPQVLPPEDEQFVPGDEETTSKGSP
jgi:hypothetical protein